MSQNLITQHAPETPFGEIYQLDGSKPLGKGNGGTVRVVIHRKTGEKFAMKSMYKGHAGDPDKLRELVNEIEIMAEVDCPHIVKLVETFEDDNFIHLILELCTGGELLSRLEKEHQYSEATAAKLLRDILKAVKYLHSNHIVHRDLKLENFLFSNPSQDSMLKLIDFGFSRHFKDHRKMHVCVGTPYYLAPEMLKGSYGKECDMWGVGVLAFMLLMGQAPFTGANETELLDNVRQGEYVFPPEVEISDTAEDFVRSLLQLDITKRLTAEAAMKHPFIQQARPEGQPLRAMHPDVLSRLVDYRNHRGLRKVMQEAIAYSLQPHEIQLLQKEFENADVEGNGVITVNDFMNVVKRSVDPALVPKIFENVKVDKRDGNVHWSEFLAATVDVSMVDEAHMRVAFERLDKDEDGYITMQDLQTIVGNDFSHEEVQSMMMEVCEEGCDPKDARLSYEGFLRFMQYTTRSSAHHHILAGLWGTTVKQMKLGKRTLGKSLSGKLRHSHTRADSTQELSGAESDDITVPCHNTDQRTPISKVAAVE